MNLKQYAAFTASTAVYPLDQAREYLSLGLFSELGEVAGILKRAIRDGKGLVDLDKLRDELGDCLWYLVQLFGPAPELWSIAWDDASRYPAPHKSDLGLMQKVGNTTLTPDMRVVSFVRLVRRYYFTIDELMEANTAKLSGRMTRGTIHGAGDGR